MTSNQIAYAKSVEENRANVQNERLKAESNQLTRESNAIASMNALTNQRQADLRAQELQQNYFLQSARQAEEARHNQAMEYETGRSNLAREEETKWLNRHDQELKTWQTVKSGIHHSDEMAMQKYSIDQQYKTGKRNTLANLATGLLKSAGTILPILGI